MKALTHFLATALTLVCAASFAASPATEPPIVPEPELVATTSADGLLAEVMEQFSVDPSLLVVPDDEVFLDPDTSWDGSCEEMCPFPSEPNVPERDCRELSSICRGPIGYVPDDHPSINAAISSPNNYGLIVVRPGDYRENVVMNRTVCVAADNSDWEENDVRIIADVDSRPAVIMMADRSCLSGFQIEQPGTGDGIAIDAPSKGKVFGALVLDNVVDLTATPREAAYGITFHGGDLTTIAHNLIVGNRDREGIAFMNDLGFSNNRVYGNRISGFTKGIRLAGYTLYGSYQPIHYNTIAHNYIRASDVGLHSVSFWNFGPTVKVSDNMWLGNTVVDGVVKGVELLGTQRERFMGNTIAGVADGFLIGSTAVGDTNSFDNRVCGNSVSSTHWGIAVGFSQDSLFSNNNIGMTSGSGSTGYDFLVGSTDAILCGGSVFSADAWLQVMPPVGGGFSMPVRPARVPFI